MNLDGYKYTLLKNPIGNNLSVETWNDCTSMILYQADNGKVVLSYSQLEQLVEFVNSAKNNDPVYKEIGLTQRAADGGQPLPLFCPVHHISYQAVDGCPECDRRR